MKQHLDQLATQLQGELYHSETMRLLYATDGSHYRELPLAVAMPKNKQDIKKLIDFANRHKTSLIPRTAGTSLAGQVVGNGIVVDVSKYMNQILEVKAEEHWVRVQPGVVRDELNQYLKPLGRFFGPETSTANRAMIGGMVGNNSCGAGSIVYGSTRDHVLEITGFLSDGSEVTFNAIDNATFFKKCEEKTLEGNAYRTLRNILSVPENQEEIRREFPKPNIPRRNTGYALDLLLETAPFTQDKPLFNMCQLIAGSEGTLMFITEIKLHVNNLPPAHKCLVAIHCKDVIESLHANLVALKYQPYASELIDKFILDCSKENAEHRHNRFFIQGDPGAIIVAEIACDTPEERDSRSQAMIAELQEKQLGYAFPVLYGEDMTKVWNLRKAGLGLLGNIKGDAKPVELVEDTAVDVEDLPTYIEEFYQILDKHRIKSVFYAHAGTGELHIKPLINLKTAEGHKQFREVAEDSAKLVKKYNGSLSGEHGDGRLRGEFIPLMVGQKNYELLRQVKKAFDENNIFNPNKITDTPPMDKFLRHEPGHKTHEPETIFNFSESGGLVHMAEQCTGSADCRKSHLIGGTMCPSYMATKSEKDTTRARANILREVMNDSSKTMQQKLSSEEIYEVMDLCLSCKGCKGECPSNVDVAKMKAEFLQHYYDAKGVPFRTNLIANFSALNKLAAVAPALYNFTFKNTLTAPLAKKIAGFAAQRSMPELHSTTVKKWYKKNKSKQFGVKPLAQNGKVYLFCDEFTDYNDTPIGITAIQLLTKLGYEVIIPNHIESGRTYLSKGLVRKAKEIAIQNIDLLKNLVSEQTPIIGIEPSAALTLRDEYLDLCRPDQQEAAQNIAKNTFLIDEFLAKEIEAKKINKDWFKAEKQLIKLHGHCHQKALASLVATKKMLTLPQGYEVQLIPSGCCGMAGSFGYEAEHYEVSMKIAELVLLPTVRQQPENVIIAAPGTSCRHQIKDGTGRIAQHPVEILWKALK
jgi:FAD/FMN-containing dehydrogenase/Fe-S oxidoreductase